MKKFWKVIGIVFLVVFILLIAALIGGYVFLKNLDVTKYKPQIINLASQALGRQVDFNNINLKISLSQGVRLSLSGFSIAENPDFGSEHFVSVDKIDAGLNVLSFIFDRKISLPNILIFSPRINIIRDALGHLNAQTLGQSLQNAPVKQQVSPASAAALPAIFITSFKIEDAQVHFIDNSIQPQQKIAVTGLNLNVRNFSLISPFDLWLDAAVLSAQTNLRINGKIQLRLSKNEVKLKDVDVSFDLNQLPLEQLKSLSLLKGVFIPQALKGQIKSKIKQAVISDKGLSGLVMDVSLSEGQISAADIAPGISLEAKQIEFSLADFSLDGPKSFQVNLTAALYQEQTNIDFKGEVFLNPKTMEGSFSRGEFLTDLGLWPLEKIKSAVLPLKEISLPQQLSGKLRAVVKDLKFSAGGIKTVLLDAEVSKGEITLENILPGVSLAFNKIDLAVKNFSLNRPFFISLKTAYLSQEQDISFSGNIAYDLNTQDAVVKDAVVGLDLGVFSLERFKSSGLLPSGVVFPQSAGGKLEARINDLSVSAKGLKQLNMDLSWLNGKISIPEVAPGISVTANNINLNIKNFSLKEAFIFTASLGYESQEPNISFSGKAAIDAVDQNIHLIQANIKTDLAKIPLERLKTTIAPLKNIALPGILKGQLNVSVRELVAGAKGLKTIKADFLLKGGEISMKEVSPGVSFAASGINVDIKDFGLGNFFGFNIELAYLNALPNIKAKGKAALRIEDQSVMVKDTAVETDLSSLSLEKLKSSIAALKNVSLPEKLDGKFNAVIVEAIAGANGLSQLTCNGSLKGGAIKLKELALPVKGLETNFSLVNQEFTMDTIRALIGKGQITADLGVKDYLKRQNFILSAEIKGLDLSEILDQKQSPVKVEGLVYGSLKAQGSGADINSITGNGNFEVKEAKLKDFNVLKTLLDKISFLPDVASRVEAKLADKYKEKLNNKDTDIRKILVVCLVSKGMALLEPVSVEADEFIFSGKSQAGFDQKYSLDGTFKIPEELSSAMVNGVAEMQYLFDENNNISLPVHITGQGSGQPVISVTQTALDMGKNVLRNEGKKELGKFLDKVLGTGQQTAPAEPGSQQPAETSQGQGSAASEIIDSIFKKVFK